MVSLLEVWLILKCGADSIVGILVTSGKKTITPFASITSHMKSSHPDVLIIGGGVIGLTCAWYLAREGALVKIIDQGEPARESSWAGAGILSAPPSKDLAEKPLDLMLAHSSEAFPQISMELKERTGIDNGYRPCGGVELLDESLLPFEQELTSSWRQAGIDFEAMSPEAHQQIEPRINSYLGKLFYFPTVAQVRNPRHVKALLADCLQRGVEIQGGCAAHGWERGESLIHGVQTSQGRLSAGRYLVTSGAWTQLLLAPLNLETGIHPVRGQIVLLRCSSPVLSRVIQCGKRYLVPRPDGRVLVGSTEEDVGFLKQTTAAGIEELLRFACVLVPALAEAQIERCWAGLRPGRSTPLLGEVPGLENLTVAAGHYRSGIQLSPATGMLIKEMILGQPPTISIDELKPHQLTKHEHV